MLIQQDTIVGQSIYIRCKDLIRAMKTDIVHALELQWRLVTFHKKF